MKRPLLLILFLLALPMTDSVLAQDKKPENRSDIKTRLRVCRGCKAEYPSGIYCPKDGKVLAIVTRHHRCPKCERKYPLDDFFCSKDGARLLVAEVETKQEARCPKCTTIYDIDQKFCPKDGGRLVIGLKTPETPLPSCPKCDLSFNDGTKFCPEDGAKLVLKLKTGWDGQYPPDWANWSQEQRRNHRTELAKANTALAEQLGESKLGKSEKTRREISTLLLQLSNTGVSVADASRFCQQIIQHELPSAEMMLAARLLAEEGHARGLSFNDLADIAMVKVKEGSKGEDLQKALKEEINKQLKAKGK